MVRYSSAYKRRQQFRMRHYPIRKSRIKGVTFKDVLFLAIAGLILLGLLHSAQGLVVNLFDGFAKVRAAAAKELPQIQVHEKIIEIPAPPHRDIRVEKLQNFLDSKQSPLSAYALEIVKNADRYGLAYTDIVAISSIESRYCTDTIEGSHNCWGLGGERGFMHFDNYPTAIAYVSKLIGEDYVLNKNMGIQVKYCPTIECHQSWPQVVTAAAKEILAVK